MSGTPHPGSRHGRSADSGTKPVTVERDEVSVSVETRGVVFLSMSDAKTMVRTTLAVGESVYLLAQGQDYKALERRIEKALDDGGRFVEFVVVGNRTVSILIARSQSVVFLVETVPFDDRDTGDVDYPFGGFHDTWVDPI